MTVLAAILILLAAIIAAGQHRQPVRRRRRAASPTRRPRRIAVRKPDDEVVRTVRPAGGPAVQVRVAGDSSRCEDCGWWSPDVVYRNVYGAVLCDECDREMLDS